MNSLTCALRQLTPRFVVEVLHRRVEPAGGRRPGDIRGGEYPVACAHAPNDHVAY
ncbi:hypothetical protein J2W30_004394 [Variovorax boronicumulans]|nr:hypothetical protein [Variovorax boronicumulans]